MLITVEILIWMKGHQKPCNKVASQSLANQQDSNQKLSHFKNGMLSHIATFPVVVKVSKCRH